MAKIVLHEYPKQERYRAVIGHGSRVGWAYPLKQYTRDGVEVLEALVDEYGKPDDHPIYRFTRDGDKWVADSNSPINPSSMRDEFP